MAAGGCEGLDPYLDPDLGLDPDLDTDMDLDANVDPDMGQDPNLDPDMGLGPDLGLDPDMDPDMGLDPNMDLDLGLGTSGPAAACWLEPRPPGPLRHCHGPCRLAGLEHCRAAALEPAGRHTRKVREWVEMRQECVTL